jgi:hypothetical protein
MKGDSIIASMDSCTFKIDTSYTQFTTLEFPTAIQSSLVPDSLLIIVASGLGSGFVGTELIVDELTFQAGVPTTVLEPGTLPGEFSLHQNYPNPFNPSTTIRYALPDASVVRLVVYDLLGRAVAVLAEGMKEAGLHETLFDAAGLPSGVYFYRLQAGGFAATKKLALTK